MGASTLKEDDRWTGKQRNVPTPFERPLGLTNLVVAPGRMGKGAGWQRRVEGFVLDRIGAPPARILEVGCGKGDLALVLDRAGHSVTAIDPRAPEGPIFRRVGIEDFSEPGPFDHVVAILSLHHVEDLGGALDKMAGLLHTVGTLVVVEFAWDRIDSRTAEWALARLPDASASGKHSWLERWCRRRACDGGDKAGASQAEAQVAECAGEEGLHSSGRMREKIGRRFVERSFVWWPYLYPDLDDDTSEADELAAIEAGEINATSFCYVGAVASERSAFAG
jgi:SAM-dependent methyltransferase